MWSAAARRRFSCRRNLLLSLAFFGGRRKSGSKTPALNKLPLRRRPHFRLDPGAVSFFYEALRTENCSYDAPQDFQ
jgi:hypothetical protein